MTATAAETWSQAPCRTSDPEMWFFDVGTAGESRDYINVMRVCWTCPLQLACLNLAVQYKETVGVWGGFSGRSLRRLVSAGVVLEELPPMPDHLRKALEFKPQIT